MSDDFTVVPKEGDFNVLPDGSAFFTASFPLPKDHWLYAPHCAEWDDARGTSADTPYPILHVSLRDAVIAAAKYAVRGATMCGKDMDFDPDALVKNVAYALCGPFAAPVVAPVAEPVAAGETQRLGVESFSSFESGEPEPAPRKILVDVPKWV